jgi:indole-3-glycerol phosphate synthase
MQIISLDEMKKKALQTKEQGSIKPRGFANALRGKEISIIAEIKHRSPSKGILCRNFNHIELAKAYAEAGAKAMSVLTDAEFFGGAKRYIPEVRKTTNLPVLRKDFIIHPYQIYEACILGADAVLLIAAILDDEVLKELCDLAQDFGIDVLLEVHDEKELKRAMNMGAKLIGINNRDLNTFATNVNTTFKLCEFVKSVNEDVVLVSESGIKSRADIENLKKHGVNAVLIGEALVTADDPKAKLNELLDTN